MANGWGGRRTGAGAPKGNNNAVQHGDYCRPKVDVDCSSTRELRVMNAAILRIQFSLPEMGKGTPSEVREYLRLNGMSGWVTDKIIQATRKKSKDRLKEIEAKRREAKTELLEAKARLIAAKHQFRLRVNTSD
ncbi:MAG: hypothetical protein EOM46_00060 [Gammaproteobacteria bacterium]|nr:hypothetical protein [Gammaproteobacteria bacterium]